MDLQLIVRDLIVALCSIALGYLLKTMFTRKAEQSAAQLTANAKRDAEAIVKEAKIAARDELLRSKDEFEKATRERRVEIQKIEERLTGREANIERKVDLIESRLTDLDKRESRLRQQEEEVREQSTKLSQLRTQEMQELERIAGLSKDQAREQFMTRLASELEGERGALIRRFQEEAKQECEREGHEVMITAMERYAGDCAYERTTSTIPLPTDEMKGRIIGREGRNIRAIEAATGVSVLIDDTPEAVVISCFDPVRREIARVALERLITDGRIHPTRIEEMVEKVTREIDGEIQKAGQAAIDRLGISGVKQNLVKLVGRLKYRYSYSQNVLAHSVEVAHFLGTIAAQLNMDEQKARRVGLFHDIGKAVDHEVEGSHAAIGADLLKRNGEDDEIVRAVNCHHEEVECTTPYGVLLKLCDKLSASRPGARTETTELYLKRLEQLESIGRSFPGVEACFAIQAGRELRVLIQPEKIDENKALLLARDIANKIENDMRYPGQIRVTVIRETRAIEYAK